MYTMVHQIINHSSNPSFRNFSLKLTFLFLGDGILFFQLLTFTSPDGLP